MTTRGLVQGIGPRRVPPAATFALLCQAQAIRHGSRSPVDNGSSRATLGDSRGYLGGAGRLRCDRCQGRSRAGGAAGSSRGGDGGINAMAATGDRWEELLGALRNSIACPRAGGRCRCSSCSGRSIGSGAVTTRRRSTAISSSSAGGLPAPRWDRRSRTSGRSSRSASAGSVSARPSWRVRWRGRGLRPTGCSRALGGVRSRCPRGRPSAGGCALGGRRDSGGGRARARRAARRGARRGGRRGGHRGGRGRRRRRSSPKHAGGPRPSSPQRGGQASSCWRRRAPRRRTPPRACGGHNSAAGLLIVTAFCTRRRAASREPALRRRSRPGIVSTRPLLLRLAGTRAARPRHRRAASLRAARDRA